MTLKSICRIKGQEENTLQGLGIVVGLKGTGDAGTYLPTIRSLAKVMSVMDMPTSKAGLTELKDTKNVALVIVTATVPGAGLAKATSSIASSARWVRRRAWPGDACS